LPATSSGVKHSGQFGLSMSSINAGYAYRVLDGTASPGRTYQESCRRTTAIKICVLGVLRLSWTLADLDGVTVPSAEHVGRALYLRKAMSS
jgi:predicted ATPase with chaperone activity